MRDTDIAIVGGGLAGSLAATMLGRAGYSVTLIDPFDTCRPDFRCEKLEEARGDEHGRSEKTHARHSLARARSVRTATDA